MTNLEDFKKEIIKYLEVNIKIDFPVITFNHLKGIKTTPNQMAAWKVLGIVKRVTK